jgi:hypothetical protein
MTQIVLSCKPRFPLRRGSSNNGDGLVRNGENWEWQRQQQRHMERMATKRGRRRQ